MRDYRFTPRAERDLVAARRWYNRQGADLGVRFAAAVTKALDFVRTKPEALAVASGDVRAIKCRDFPYRIYYHTAGDTIVILAVYHTSRAPDQWDDQRRR
jgi:plasmid stabilization system protein ParE